MPYEHMALSHTFRVLDYGLNYHLHVLLLLQSVPRRLFQ
jgi:hypothetical protein